MARTNNLTDFLTDVSSAIKQKTGDNTPIPASEFDTEILSIETGGNYQSKTLNVAQNGNYNLLPDTGYDAISDVSISVSVSPILQNKTITENGSYTADQNYDGLGTVIVNVVDPEYATNLALSQQILAGTSLYTELEYIQSTGTQYIDTGIYPTTINKIDVAAMFTAEIDNPLFGTRASQTGDKLAIGINYLNTETRNMIQYGYGKRGWTRISTSYIPINSYFTLSYEFVIDGSSGKISWNNSYENVYDDSGSGLSELSNVSIYLFGYNTPYTESGYICGQNRIYNCKMYGYSGSLVRDLIPVKRTSDNEICMFDKVTNQFFTNAGTGQFIAGPEVN